MKLDAHQHSRARNIIPWVRRSDVKLDVYEFREVGPHEVLTRWRFSCLLDLPWRPRIAAAGGCVGWVGRPCCRCWWVGVWVGLSGRCLGWVGWPALCNLIALLGGWDKLLLCATAL